MAAPAAHALSSGPRTHAARTPPISESRQPPHAPRLPRRFATSPADRKRKRASARPGEAPGRGRRAGRRGRGAVLPPAARRGLASPVSGEEAGAPVLCALRHRVPVAVIVTYLGNLRAESQHSVPLAPGECSCFYNRCDGKCMALRVTSRHLGFIQTEYYCRLLNWIKRIIICQICTCGKVEMRPFLMGRNRVINA